MALMKPLTRYILLLTALLSCAALAATDRTKTVQQPKSRNNQSAAPAQNKQSQKNSQKKLWNLQKADIRAVIEAVSRITGKNFLVDPRVEGKITLVSSAPIGPEGLYQMFLSALQVLGYSAVPSGDVIKIVPNTYARQMNIPIADQFNPGKGDQMVVRIVHMKNVPVAQIVSVLRPLMPESSTVSAYQPSNSLILAGRANNVNRLALIIHNIDLSGSNQIQVVPLKHAAASKVLNVLQQLQNAQRASGKISGISLAADAQSNTIILSGTRQQRMRMAVLVDKLDTTGPSTGSNTRVIKLNYLKAKKIAPVLAKIAHSAYLNESGQKAKGKGKSSSAGNNSAASTAASEDNFNKEVSIQPEPDSNSVIISAPPALMATLQRVIKEVDIKPQQVLVEAIIAEVSQSLANKLGISWGTGATDATDNGIQLNAGASSSGNSDTGFKPGIGFISAGSFTNIGILKQNNIEAVIQALNTNSDADILSTPSIMVANNQKAKFSIGKTIYTENRQYAKDQDEGSSEFTPFTTVKPTKVDLTLNVTPQISPDQTVQLKLKQIDDSLENPENPGVRPIINNSDMETAVLVKSGETLVLGGLLSHNLVNSISKIPLLGSLPIVGRLFQMKDKQIEKKYLLVFIRPVILNTNQRIEQVTQHNYNFIRNLQLKRWRGQDLITQDNQAPLMPAYNQPKLKLPKPFHYSGFQKY